MALTKAALSIFLIVIAPVVTVSFQATAWKYCAAECASATGFGNHARKDWSMAFPLKAKKNSFDHTIYGSYEDGKIAISRNDKQSQFELYYRIYHKKSQASRPPHVVLHGGP